MTEAQAAETLFARYQSQDQDEGETGEESPPEDDADEQSEADPEDQSDEQDDPDEAEPAKTFRVKIDGEEVEVTEDELVKGYSREKDYTRKTQALAEDRKAVQTEKQAAADARDQYVQRLEAVSQIIEQAQPRVDQSLRTTNTAEWSAQMHMHRQWSEQKQAVEAARTAAAQEADREKDAERAAFVRQNREKLPELIPEWRDTKVQEVEVPKLYQHGIERGFSPEEMDDLADSRAVAILRDAMKYRELMDKKPEVQSKLQTVKTMKPGSPTPSRGQDERRARERLANDGSTDAAARLILMKTRRA